MTIKLTATQKIKVINSSDLYNVMQQLLLHEKKIDRDKEHFWLVCLSNNNRILMIELISLGSVKSTVVEPMDVFSFALQKRAVKLIMVHNHPSDEMRPSQSDIDLTKRMYAIGKFIQMPILDHLIISEKEFYSFKEAGLMRKIEEEKRYDLTFSEIDKVTAQLKKAEKEKIAVEKQLALAEKKREKALREDKLVSAKKLLTQGVNIEVIATSLGLTKKAIEKLK